MNRSEDRDRVVAEARRWIKTPFHDCCDAIHGQGVDCAHLAYQIYRNVGLVPEIKIPPYSYQIMLNSSKELFIPIIEQCGGIEVLVPTGPGDIVLWKFGRSFSHGAIITVWPRVVHASRGAGGVFEDNTDRVGLLQRDEHGMPRARKFFTILGKP